MKDNFTEIERRVAWYALVVAGPCALATFVLGTVHGYGQRSVSNLAGLSYDAASIILFVALGALLGVTMVAEIRGDSA